MVEATPFVSVFTTAAVRLPEVVENVTGVPVKGFPFTSSTFAVIVVEPPTAGTVAGLALTATRPTAAVPTAILSAPLLPSSRRRTKQ